MSRIPVPLWLRVWLALQVAGFVAGVFLDPGPPRIMRWLIWSVSMLLLGWAMWKHVKGAWVVAVVFGAVTVFGSLPALFQRPARSGQVFVWLIWGLAFGVIDLATLVSRPALDWVTEPVETQRNHPDSQVDR